MLVLNKSQRKLYSYIKRGRYKGMGQAVKELGLNRQTLWQYIKLLSVAGYIEAQSPYRATKRN